MALVGGGRGVLLFLSFSFLLLLLGRETKSKGKMTREAKRSPTTPEETIVSSEVETTVCVCYSLLHSIQRHCRCFGALVTNLAQCRAHCHSTFWNSLKKKALSEIKEEDRREREKKK